MIVAGGGRRSKKTAKKKAVKKGKKVEGGGGDCGDNYGTFPMPSDGYMYGLPSGDLSGHGNCTINVASQIASSITPVVPSYAVVDFGQGVNDPISPAGSHFMGGGKKKKKRAAAGGKKKKRAAAGGKKKKTATKGKSTWMLTEFKVKITNSEGKKVVKSLFYNAGTGEYRVRKMIKKGRKKVARFSTIPKTAEFVR